MNFNSTIGVPQGSILGAFFPISYANNINDKVQSSHCVSYEDDFSVVFCSKDVENLVFQTTEIIQEIAKYFII